MKTLKVTSSHIDLIMFNDTTKNLVIVFKSGSIYKYSDVPTSIFQQISDADSKGKFARQHIYKDYTFQRLN